MADLDPARPCTTFRPPHAGRGRRRATALLFVEQGGARFVVKSYAVPGEPASASAARLQREIDGEAAFLALGEAVLHRCGGPHERLRLEVDGAPVTLEQALVFPYLPAPTLFDLLRGATAPSRPGAPRDDAAVPLLREAAQRMASRHRHAARVADLHSDGAAHNILVHGDATVGTRGWFWFDFAEPHAAGADGGAGAGGPGTSGTGAGSADTSNPGDASVAEATAVETLALLLSVVEASRAGLERGRVEAFCAAYVEAGGAPAVLRRALALRAPERPSLYSWRHRLRLRSWLALARGDTTQLARYRLWRALDGTLRRPVAGPPDAVENRVRAKL